MSAQKKGNINLLPQKGFESTTTGRVVGWFLGTFRIILIVTEIIVMGAFFSRFYLDAINSDLSEEIIQKKAVIESYSKTEAEFRSVQNKLKFLSQTVSNASLKSKLLDGIRVSLPDNPAELSLENIQISDKNITLSGSALAEKNVLQLMSNLDSNELIEKVLLQNISSKSNDAYLSFSLTMSVSEIGNINTK